MRWSVRRKTIAFVVLGCVGVGGAVALNIGWIIVSWREAGLLVAGLILFPLIITGVILNTIFLVREIRRNEQHENFINAVTHELKTPIASVKLHLQTLQQRQVDESKRQEFYQVMVDDCDRLLGTVEQVLRAGRLRTPQAKGGFRPIELGTLVEECLALAQTRYRLTPGELTYTTKFRGGQQPRGEQVSRQPRQHHAAGVGPAHPNHQQQGDRDGKCGHHKPPRDPPQRQR